MTLVAEKLETGELYRGPCGILKASNWLTAESLPADVDTIVQIEAVIRRKHVEFIRGGKVEQKANYGSIRFVGKERELGLNATHIRVLAALFGSNTASWFNQHIALYVDPAVSAFGHVVSAVRIRAKKVDAPTKRVAAPAADDIFRQPGDESL